MIESRLLWLCRREWHTPGRSNQVVLVIGEGPDEDLSSNSFLPVPSYRFLFL
jgi:hypothetical protein